MKPVTPHQSNPAMTAVALAYDPHDIGTVRADVDKLLHAFYKRKISAAQLLDAAYGRLWQVVSNLAFAGGKRLRPWLVVLAYEMYGGKNYQAVLPVAAAQELLHLALLIHDDIADKDDVRYGTDNVSGQYVKIYTAMMAAKTEGRSVTRHAAQSAALLAGDLLLTSAQTMVLDSQFDADKKLAAHRLVGDSIFRVAAGQLLDMEAGMDAMPRTDTTKIASLKTASYSFVGPLQCGALLAGAPPAEIEKLGRLGLSLGQAFQLADDLLGVFGDEQVTGKSNLTDLKEGKHTYVMQTTFERASKAELAYIGRYFGRDSLTRDRADVIRQIIITCGARDSVEARLESYHRDITVQLRELTVSAVAKRQLEQLAQTVVRRDR